MIQLQITRMVKNTIKLLVLLPSDYYGDIDQNRQINCLKLQFSPHFYKMF